MEFLGKLTGSLRNEWVYFHGVISLVKIGDDLETERDL